MKTKFYICRHCGNIIEKINDAGVPVMCCGQKMEPLTPNTTDAAGEKHVPAVTVDGNVVSVKVGTVAHPMTEAHSILWIYLETDKGGYRRNLTPTDAPEAEFVLKDEKPVAVYAYCNLHSLWAVEL